MSFSIHNHAFNVSTPQTTAKRRPVVIEGEVSRHNSNTQQNRSSTEPSRNQSTHRSSPQEQIVEAQPVQDNHAPLGSKHVIKNYTPSNHFIAVSQASLTDANIGNTIDTFA